MKSREHEYSVSGIQAVCKYINSSYERNAFLIEPTLTDSELVKPTHLSFYTDGDGWTELVTF
jgi:hypothetical protein